MNNQQELYFSLLKESNMKMNATDIHQNHLTTIALKKKKNAAGLNVASKHWNI